MKAFKVVIKFEEKAGFTLEGLKSAIQEDLSEIDLKLIDFAYEKDNYDLSSDLPAINKKLSSCECIMEFKEFAPTLPYHQIVLGGIQNIPEKYPYFDIHSIEPSFVETK